MQFANLVFRQANSFKRTLSNDTKAKQTLLEVVLYFGGVNAVCVLAIIYKLHFSGRSIKGRYPKW